MDRRMEVQFVSQSARLWVWLVATCLVTTYPAALAAQGFDPPPTPAIPSHAAAARQTAPRPTPAAARPRADRPTRFERLPPITQAAKARPVPVVERLPSIEDVLVNPAKAAELDAAAAEARSAETATSEPAASPPVAYKEFELAKSDKLVKPARPSTLSEPTVLAKRTPRSYADLNPQRS